MNLSVKSALGILLDAAAKRAGVVFALSFPANIRDEQRPSAGA